MKAYKGFTKELKCRDFQYEIGKEYAEEHADLCCSGFHACEYPLDTFRYYEPAQSRFCEVDLDDVCDKTDYDTKRCGKKIKIGAELTIAGLVKASVEYVQEKATPTKTNHTKKNNCANSATGYGSANISTGIECENNGAGERNICIGWGKNNKCKGKIGCFLVLSEWSEWDGERYPFIAAKMVEVDGVNIKEDTWYTLRNGKIVEVGEE